MFSTNRIACKSSVREHDAGHHSDTVDETDYSQIWLQIKSYMWLGIPYGCLFHALLSPNAVSIESYPFLVSCVSFCVRMYINKMKSVVTAWFNHIEDSAFIQCFVSRKLCLLHFIVQYCSSEGKQQKQQQAGDSKYTLNE